VAVLAAACSSAPQDPDMLAARDTYATCATCHGKTGEGGAGPALATVRETFPDCEDQVRWISLGSNRWKQEVGPSYGAGGTPVEGAMPSFENLGDTAIRRVAMYERVRFGGGTIEDERLACGLG
jgi:mono/diheme cytochrome c family protein